MRSYPAYPKGLSLDEASDGRSPGISNYVAFGVSLYRPLGRHVNRGGYGYGLPASALDVSINNILEGRCPKEQKPLGTYIH
jgi:hypothetical protein